MTTSPFGWLGVVAPSSSSDAAVYENLEGLRQAVNTSLKKATVAYNGLKKTREKLGLDFITYKSGEGTAETSGGWSEDLEAQAQDLHAMATFLDQCTTDVKSGKRDLNWNKDFQNFSISALPGDPFYLAVTQNGVPVLVDSKTNQQTHVQAPFGVGVIHWIVAAAVAVQAVEFVGIYFLVKKGLETIETVSQQKTQQSVLEVAKKNADNVASGKMTAAEADKSNQTIIKGATDLQKEQNAVKLADAKTSSDFASTLMTLGYVALGIAGVVTLGKLIPSKQLLENAASPRVRAGYAYSTGRAQGLKSKDWMYAKDEDWDTVLVDAPRGQYRYLGTRNIDGTKMFVWVEPSKHRYVAQTAHGFLENPKQGWVAEMFVEGKWSRNAIVLPSKKQAEAYASDMFSRWTLPTDKRVKRVAQTPNYEWTSEGLRALGEGVFQGHKVQ